MVLLVELKEHYNNDTMEPAHNTSYYSETCL